MVSVIGLDKAKVAELCEAAKEKSGEQIGIANYLCNGNYAVSGSSAACEAVNELAKPEFKARMTVKLAVAGAFHTDFMKPAVESLEKVLSEVEIKTPAVPLVANVRAEAVTDPDVIRQLLVEQVTGSVRWRETVGYMAAQGVTEIWEIGAGKALSGMVRRIDRSIACRAVGASADVTAAVEALNG